jgi:Protein of unknown function (DUF2855)
MNTSTFLVKKSDLSQTQLSLAAQEPLEAGQIRLRIDIFSLTANNITYASFGDAMSYWNFYPRPASDDGQANEWGVIPVWGFANVTESLCEGIAVGQRFYGYYPAANEAVLIPSRVSSARFSVAGHREALAAVYNQYVNCAADPFYAHGSEAIQCLLRPLFITSWLIDDLLADNDFYGSEAVIMSSASSKTAYGTAFCMAQRAKNQRPKIIGLTSPGNVAFSESLGCYDQIITYDQLETLEAARPCTYVDFAGNAALRMRIHSQFSHLKYSCSVGGTHVQELGGAKGLPGPKATLFFAPAQIAKRAKDWGRTDLNTRLVQAWKAFSEAVSQAAPPWLKVTQHSATDAPQAYQTLLKGQSDPRSGQVWSL